MMMPFVVFAAKNEGNWAAEIMQVFLKHGVMHGVDPISAVNKIDSTPIHYAAQNESSSGPKLMKLLLEQGWDPNTPSVCLKLFTPVHLVALNQGNYAAKMLNLLLDNGGACDALVEEPIHLTMINNNGECALELLDILIKKRGDVNVLHERTGISLIHLAVMLDNGERGLNIIKKLLEKGADPNRPSVKAYTPVHLAAIGTGETAPERMKIL
jgi:ankyrin repeat protein